MKASTLRTVFLLIILAAGTTLGYLLPGDPWSSSSLDLQEGHELRVNALGANVRLLLANERGRLSVLQEIPNISADVFMVSTDAAGSMELWLRGRSRLGLEFDSAGLLHLNHFIEDEERTLFVADTNGDAIPDFRSGGQYEIELFVDGQFIPAKKVLGEGYAVGDEVYRMVDGKWQSVSE